MSLGITKKIVLLILIVYGAMGLYVNTLPRHELYPFYAWNLFSSAPTDEKAYFIKIIRYDNKSFDTLLYGDLVTDFLKVEYKPDFFWQVQKMAGDGSVRKSIENNFLLRPVDYQLVEVEYNPLELLKYGKEREEKVIYETHLY